MKRLRSFLLVVGLATTIHAGAASATCGIGGTIYAEPVGASWRYCIDFRYLILDPIVTVSLFLPECQPGCDPSRVWFPGIVGLGNDGWILGLEFPPINDPCVGYVYGRFYCDGDSALNAPRYPTITWSRWPSGCVPHLNGGGHVCFDSGVAPSTPREQTNAITIRTTAGQCWGTLNGVFPGCSPPTPVRGLTWGTLKALAPR